MRFIKLADSENDVGHTVYINHLFSSLYFHRSIFCFARLPHMPQTLLSIMTTIGCTSFTSWTSDT